MLLLYTCVFSHTAAYKVVLLIQVLAGRAFKLLVLQLAVYALYRGRVALNEAYMEFWASPCWSEVQIPASTSQASMVAADHNSDLNNLMPVTATASANASVRAMLPCALWLLKRVQASMSAVFLVAGAMLMITILLQMPDRGHDAFMRCKSTHSMKLSEPNAMRALWQTALDSC